MPKNDEYFSEFTKRINLKPLQVLMDHWISDNFKEKNLLFVDGDMLSKLKFRLVKISKYWNTKKNFTSNFKFRSKFRI